MPMKNPPHSRQGRACVLSPLGLVTEAQGPFGRQALSPGELPRSHIRHGGPARRPSALRRRLG